MRAMQVLELCNARSTSLYGRRPALSAAPSQKHMHTHGRCRASRLHRLAAAKVSYATTYTELPVLLCTNASTASGIQFQHTGNPLRFAFCRLRKVQLHSRHSQALDSVQRFTTPMHVCPFCCMSAAASLCLKLHKSLLDSFVPTEQSFSTGPAPHKA